MEIWTETTIEERKLVIKLSNEGKSQRNIAKVVGRSVNCIQKILQKFKKTASTSNTLGRSASAETVRRKAGYNGSVARKKPLIGKRNSQAIEIRQRTHFKASTVLERSHFQR
ncbi:hypothetical protein TNCV_1537921 [Trichonephila clavipes]|nr:hypothetical protein TNCV_1537921 [Trichonephila clavipes]